MKFNGFVFLLISFSLLSCRKVNKDCNQNIYENAPEKEWIKSHDGSKEESHGHFIMTCSDGGFLQIGETGFITSSSHLLVIKTNSNGELIWKKEFYVGNHNLGNSAIETNDGYIICGSLNENSTVINLNKENGEVIFKTTIDNGGTDAFEHIAKIENGYVAVGYVNAADRLNTFYTEGQGYITFLNEEGNKVNGINFNAYLSHAYRIKYFNNELIIAGLTEDSNDYGVIKTDTSGNVIWNKTYGGSQPDHCFGMDINDEGEIFLTGHTLSGTENWDTYTMKIDNDGNQIWETKIGNPRGFDPKYIHDEAWGVRSSADGGCVVVAGTGDEYNNYKKRCGNSGDNSNIWHVYIIKFNNTGSVDWEKTYGGDSKVNWAGEDIDLTPDGGAIVAVDNSSFGFLKIQPF